MYCIAASTLEVQGTTTAQWSRYLLLVARGPPAAVGLNPVQVSTEVKAMLTVLQSGDPDTHGVLSPSSRSSTVCNSPPLSLLKHLTLQQHAQQMRCLGGAMWRSLPRPPSRTRHHQQCSASIVARFPCIIIKYKMERTFCQYVNYIFLSERVWESMDVQVAQRFGDGVDQSICIHTPWVIVQFRHLRKQTTTPIHIFIVPQPTIT